MSGWKTHAVRRTVSIGWLIIRIHARSLGVIDIATLSVVTFCGVGRNTVADRAFYGI
jgi:hypothetical protein